MVNSVQTVVNRNQKPAVNTVAAIVAGNQKMLIIHLNSALNVAISLMKMTLFKTFLTISQFDDSRKEIIMADLQEYKCPNCGGALEFNSSIQKMKCPYCDSELDMSSLK